MHRIKMMLAIILIVVVCASLFVAIEFCINRKPSGFFVGVEFAYSDDLSDLMGTLSSLKGLVDKVKVYTNLFVIGLPEISLNETILNEACDYISNAGLHFIVLFTNTTSYSYTPHVWSMNAQQKYGDKFLGIYRLDEPGGKEIDNVPNRFLNTSKYVPQDENYTGASEEYVEILQTHLDYFHEQLYSEIFTADYALYWFNYKAGYNNVFAEFGWNHSRQINIALCRGAAKANNKDWGALITWTYQQPPYIETGPQLYDDMILAYKAGAKYVAIFDHPNSTQYGILTEEHFEALKNFWNYVCSHPQDHGVIQGTVAYVLPQDYGFGFRRSTDSIWGLWSADDLASKVWDDANKLVANYDSRLDIVYNEQELIDSIANRYDELIFWNQTIN